jgi:hypothetical protein
MNVSAWKHARTPQQPFGGDVSILLPLRRSVLFAVVLFWPLRLPCDPSRALSKPSIATLAGWVMLT